MMEENLYAIIVAGGQGTRMGAEIPKQFILLNNRPILLYTIDRFLNFEKKINLILVLPKDQIQRWTQLAETFKLDTERITIVIGGDSRFESVLNGLNAISEENGIVAVHDAVRPFITNSLIEKLFDQSFINGNAISAVPIKDSIRKLTNEGKSIAIDRKEFVFVQTPQVFKISILKKAYGLAESDSFTDDASVVEKSGVKINIIEGSYDNIKITTPEDLILAQVLLKNFKY